MKNKYKWLLGWVVLTFTLILCGGFVVLGEYLFSGFAGFVAWIFYFYFMPGFLGLKEVKR